MSKPSSKATVHHEGNKDDWVDAEGDGEESSREEDGVLDRVEARAREGGRVVALVVELVDVLVKEATLDWRTKGLNCGLRGVKYETGSGPGSQLTLQGWRRRWRR